ncbi:MAG: zinc-binding protein [Dehalococcoidia bacterium]|nr:zinc-binding protein [Dehalococcoidia bacterium]
MSYQDKTLSCFDCSQSYIFSVEEQEIHAQKGFSNAPKRCPACRQSRKDSRPSSFSSTGTGYSGGYQQREMFPAVCATCGTQTQVPFQPRADRPVYCRDCYSRTEAGSRQRR